jgi:hypothetical protein
VSWPAYPVSWPAYSVFWPAYPVFWPAYLMSRPAYSVFVVPGTVPPLPRASAGTSNFFDGASKYLCWFTPYPGQLIWKLMSP